MAHASARPGLPRQRRFGRRAGKTLCAERGAVLQRAPGVARCWVAGFGLRCFFGGP